MMTQKREEQLLQSSMRVERVGATVCGGDVT